LKLISTLLLSLFLAIQVHPVLAENTPEADLNAAFKLLSAKKFGPKIQGIELLSRSQHPRSAEFLSAILNAKLFYLKKDKSIVYVKKEESKYLLTDALTGEDKGKVSKRKVKKISINNKLRGQIKTSLARIEFANPDPAFRLMAIKKMLGTDDAFILDTLKKLKEKETNEEVSQAIKEVLAVADLESNNSVQQIAAITLLKDSLNAQIRLKIETLAKQSTNNEVKELAQKAVKGIESKISLYGFLETLFFGLSLGSILALAAIGLAITFGVMGVINMAHGELIMIGAYTTYVIQQLMPNYIGASILVAIPAAFIVSALVGIAIERGVIRFLYGRPLETLLATFGISLVLQQAVRSVFSPLNRSVATPEWMSGSLEINTLLSITYNRLYIFIFCIIIFIALYLIMKKTSLGLNVRAISQNRKMAQAMGIKTEWVDAMTFGLGSGIAGVAGVALSQITNVGPNLGQAYIIDSFMVVVFGGVGNLWGTLLSGLSLGIMGKFLEPVTGAVLAKILVLIFIILFIQKRPRGLFPQKGRAVEQ